MNIDKVKSKSIGAKKTKKKEVSPIIALMACLISKKFFDTPCQKVVIDDYNYHVMSVLKEKYPVENSKDKNETAINDILIESEIISRLKKLKSTDGTKVEEECKNSYKYIGTVTKTYDMRVAVLKQMVNVDQGFEYLVNNVPKEYIEAMFDYTALSDIFGVTITKRVNEVWEFVEKFGIEVQNRYARRK